jgi:hypothetical protein
VLGPLIFENNSEILNAEGKLFLDKFSKELYETGAEKQITLYLVGLASEVTDHKQKWSISAGRAQAAADFIKNILPSQVHCAIYSWGAGDGSHLLNSKNTDSQQPQIFLGVLIGDN